MVIQSVITHWCASIQMIIIQMGHIVNNGPSYDSIHIDSCHTVCNHTLMCVHSDGYHSDTATFPTKQKHTHIWKMLLKKKNCPKSRSLSYAPIRWQVCHSVCHEPSRECTWIQINNLPRIFYFFGGDGLILFVTLRATIFFCFFTTKTLFLSIIYSITDTNNNCPWRNET